MVRKGIHPHVVPEGNARKTVGRPFQKGNPGGPGRPKGSLTQVLREAGERGNLERGKALAERVWSKALRGNITCIKLIYDRVDGPPVQQVDHQGQISIRVTHVGRAD